MDRNDDVIAQHKVREVAAVFQSQETLENAIEALLQAGFDRGDIDVMGDIETVRKRLGALYVPSDEIADVPGTPRAPLSPATISLPRPPVSPAFYSIWAQQAPP